MTPGNSLQFHDSIHPHTKKNPFRTSLHPNQPQKSHHFHHFHPHAPSDHNSTSLSLASFPLRRHSPLRAGIELVGFPLHRLLQRRQLHVRSHADDASPAGAKTKSINRTKRAFHRHKTLSTESNVPYATKSALTTDTRRWRACHFTPPKGQGSPT